MMTSFLSVLVVLRLLLIESAATFDSNTAEIRYKFLDEKSDLVDENEFKVPENKSLIVYAHGYTSSSNHCLHFGRSLAEVTDSKVVLVDWSDWTQKLFYTENVIRLPNVAWLLVNWLNGLRDRGVFKSFDNVTLIGHSLGAQLMGYVGHRFKGIIKRVIALDPAQPNFTGSNKYERVDVKSGQFVMVLHTSTIFFGLRDPVGHVDFYFNDGKTQPLCFLNTICSHAIVLNYLVESVKNSSLFTAKRCLTLENCENNIAVTNSSIINVNMDLPISDDIVFVVVSVIFNYYVFRLALNKYIPLMVQISVTSLITV